MPPDAHLSYLCSRGEHDACTSVTCICTCHGGLGTKTAPPDLTLIGAGKQ